MPFTGTRWEMYRRYLHTRVCDELQQVPLDSVIHAPFLRSGRFWWATIVALLGAGLFFAWVLDTFSPIGLPGFARPPLTVQECILTAIIIGLFSFDIGLFLWRKRMGSCPAGTRSIAGIAGFLGAAALICPACAIGTLGFTGLATTLLILSPLFPVLQYIAVILLGALCFLLLPRGPRTNSPRCTKE